MEEKQLLDIEQLTLKKKDYSRILLIIGTVVMALFVAIGALDAIGGLETGLEWIDWLALGLMGFCGPYGFYSTAQFKRIREIESRLPDFLRDVSEGGRFGMTLAESIKVSSRGRYGRLTPEIQRMAAQIDWGVPATDAIKLFIDRVDTPLVRRMTSIVIKANDAGGNVADVLDMVAHDARETMLNRNERSITMSTYTVVIYVAFAVFLATIFILNSTFLPQMIKAGTQIDAGTTGVSNIPVQVKSDVIPEIQLIFVISVVIHAFGDGILAGVLQDGRIANGLRHSFIMLLIGLIGTRVLG
ncbi:MAG: type II secretion system F family protein [Methanomassiliicoccales archaeon]|nr:type II secretion system F family protein [Methanomassiliicoccales archaeon]